MFRGTLSGDQSLLLGRSMFRSVMSIERQEKLGHGTGKPHLRRDINRGVPGDSELVHGFQNVLVLRDNVRQPLHFHPDHWQDHLCHINARQEEALESFTGSPRAYLVFHIVSEFPQRGRLGSFSGDAFARV